MLDNLSIRTKNFLLIGLTIFTCLFMVAVSLSLLQGTLTNERRVLIADMTEMAHAVIERKYEFFQQGKITEEEAKLSAIAALRDMRYGSDGYFFISKNGVLKLHPISPEKEGKNLLNVTDPNGVKLFAEMTEVARGGNHGYVEYQWAHPSDGEPADKISFVKGFAPWDWFVGTGVYQHDMNAVLLELAKKNGVLIAISLLVFVVLVTLIFTINRSSLVRAVQLKHHLEKFSHGDFSGSVQALGKDEFGQMLVSLGHVGEKMNQSLTQLRGIANTVRVGIKEIANANQHLAQRTEQQANNLAESNTALGSISTSVRHNSDSVKQAHDFAYDAQTTVERGSGVVKQAIGAMDAITTSSSRVTEIVDVIDGIAFQTNLLALNAAVEAARAGEQGKGFAVVANEVRNLAQRSATSAQEIKSLIEESGRNVKTGSELVSRSGELLDEILHSSQKVSDTLQDIAAATQQQAEGVENTSQTISTLDEFVQKNAAMVEQVAASSKSLLSEADNMLQVVGVFRTDSSEVPAARSQGTSVWQREEFSTAHHDDEWGREPQRV